MTAPHRAALPAHWAEKCHAFYRFWSALRGDAMAAPFEAFADAAAPEFLPSTYIVEVTDTAAIVRFQGTELVDRWRKDITGRDVNGFFPPPVKARALANLRNVATLPCGLLARHLAATSAERTIMSDVILLPLAVPLERLPRLVCYSVQDRTRAHDEGLVKSYKTLNSAWIDIGAGVPAAPPLELVS